MYCYRDHVFYSKKYQILVFSTLISFRDSSGYDKYILNLESGDELSWKLNKNHQYIGFMIQKDKKLKTFRIENHLALNLKQIIDGKIIYQNFQQIYSPKEITGQGSFSKVILAQNKIDQHQYACKIIHQQQRYQYQDFLKETNPLSNIKHRNIIKMKEKYINENYFVIVTNYCSGGSLSNYIQQNKSIRFDHIISIMKQLCNAVDKIHDSQFIHRDIKPSNILFEKINDIDSLQLIDFGLTIRKDDLVDEIDTKCGTPGYMAPEITISNRQIYDQKVDVFSCGAILFELITKTRLIQEQSYNSIFNYIKQISTLKSPFTNLLKQMMHPKSNSRITIKQALITLEHIQEDEIREDEYCEMSRNPYFSPKISRMNNEQYFYSYKSQQ